SSSKYRDGCESSSREEVINSRSFDLDIATCKRRRSSSSNPCEAAAEISALEVNPVREASTNLSLPSNDPRSLRLGQTPSCKPVTTTNSHSKPFDACTVIIVTTSSRWAPVVIESLKIRSFINCEINKAG